MTAQTTSVHKLLVPLILAVMVGLCTPPSHANDTVASVAAGGITFLKSEDIRLLREDLEISTETIKVHYAFLNESSADINATVAFPMPVYGWNPGVSAADENVRPMTSFRAWVDGREAPVKIDRRAFIGGVDVTDRLRSYGLSDKQIFLTFGDCTVEGCGVRNEVIEKISKLAPGKDFPQWKVAETVYWQEAFPKGKEIVVLHEYKPFVGFSYDYPYQKKWLKGWPLIPSASDRETTSRDSKEACIDETIRKAVIDKVNKQAANGAAMVAVTLENVEYILGTGKNWKGPIRDFRLRIRKNSPDQLISVCFPGKGKKIDPLTFEFTQSDYVPQDKLIVYFITVGQSPGH